MIVIPLTSTHDAAEARVRTTQFESALPLIRWPENIYDNTALIEIAC
jgi:hypothetical protein